MRQNNSKVAAGTVLNDETLIFSYESPAFIKANKGVFLTLLLTLIISLFLVLGPEASGQSSVRPPGNAVINTIDGKPLKNYSGGGIPDAILQKQSDSDTWRAIRKGMAGKVSIADKKAGILVQDAGESYRALRSGPLFSYLGYLMLATVIALSLFFVIRGKIRVDRGLSGRTIKRFSTIERMGHWLMAISFIILAFSGLNISFGKTILMPLIGKNAFGPLSGLLKLAHNYVAFAFMAGLAIAFICWVLHNLPSRHDINWILKAGGLFSKDVHPPAKKFNAGQKMIFWSVMIGGLSLCVSGWALLFPFEYSFFASSISALSNIGINVPALIGMAEPPYSAIQEQQFNTIWHAVMAVLMICVIFAHIYIGSVGMEGAYDAMSTGEVDENWAIEHHSLWVEDVKNKEASKHEAANIQPAE